jgi:phosphomannomutase
MTITPDRVDRLRAEAARWIDDDPDPDDRAELAGLLDGLPDGAEELADRFGGVLTFGTAGLR